MVGGPKTFWGGQRDFGGAKGKVKMVIIDVIFATLAFCGRGTKGDFWYRGINCHVAFARFFANLKFVIYDVRRNLGFKPKTIS